MTSGAATPAAKRAQALPRDMAVNVAFAVINTAGALGLTRVATTVLAPAALALFLALRRYSASVSALANLGGPFVQIRYIALHSDDEQLGNLITTFVTAVYIAVIAVMCGGLWLALRIVPHAVPPDYPYWFWWLLVLLAGQQLLHFSAQNYFLVKRRIVYSNIYKFLAGTGLFLPSLILFNNVTARGAIVGYLILAACLLVAAHTHITLRALWRWRELPLDRLRWLVRVALGYGPPRAIVNFLDSLVLVLPAWLVRSDLVEVGIILTMLTFVQATGLVVLPINELAMVASADNIGTGNVEILERTTSTMFKLLLVLSCAVVAVLFPFRDVLFHVVVGSERIRAGVEGYAILLTSIVPVTVFNGMKGIIDIRWTAPRNLLNLVAAHLVAIACFFALRGHAVSLRSAVIAAFMLATWFLSMLTVVSLRTLLERVDWRATGKALAVVVALGAASGLLERVLLAYQIRTGLRLAAMIACGATTMTIALRSADTKLFWVAVEKGRRLLRATA